MSVALVITRLLKVDICHNSTKTCRHDANSTLIMTLFQRYLLIKSTNRLKESDFHYTILKTNRCFPRKRYMRDTLFSVIQQDDMFPLCVSSVHPRQLEENTLKENV
jgi:hypothetical protein